MIPHIEKGIKQPSMDLAEAIAGETNVSIDFLCQPSVVALPEGSLFRAKSNVTAKKLLQAHSIAERALEMFLKLSANFNLPVPKLRPVQGSPQQAAGSARNMLGLTPINRYRTSFELLRKLAVSSYPFQNSKEERRLQSGRVTGLSSP